MILTTGLLFAVAHMLGDVCVQRKQRRWTWITATSSHSQGSSWVFQLGFSLAQSMHRWCSVSCRHGASWSSWSLVLLNRHGISTSRRADRCGIPTGRVAESENNADILSAWRFGVFTGSRGLAGRLVSDFVIDHVVAWQTSSRRLCGHT